MRISLSELRKIIREEAERAMSEAEHDKCPECGSTEVEHGDGTGMGKRMQCNSCGHLFTRAEAPRSKSAT